jgi:hypothetical protein
VDIDNFAAPEWDSKAKTETTSTITKIRHPDTIVSPMAQGFRLQPRRGTPGTLPYAGYWGMLFCMAPSIG